MANGPDPDVEVSSVQYGDGYAADAELIARRLGIDRVVPHELEPPVSRADVVVVVGRDQAR